MQVQAIDQEPTLNDILAIDSEELASSSESIARISLSVGSWSIACTCICLCLRLTQFYGDKCKKLAGCRIVYVTA